MLIGIHPLLTADLLHAMASMGHGDELALVDANFPSVSIGKRVVNLPGASAPDALAAILTRFPLDASPGPAAFTMAVVGDPRAVPEPVAAFAAVLARSAPADAKPMVPLERHAFYERARHAFVVVRTGELRKYGNLLLVKGVVNRYDPP